MKKRAKVLLCISVLLAVPFGNIAQAEDINTGEIKVIESNMTIDSITNEGTLEILSGAGLNIDTLSNKNIVTNKGSIVAESIINIAGSDFENNGCINVSGKINNGGTIINNGELNIEGIFQNAIIINSGQNAALKTDYVVNSAGFTVADNAVISIGTI